AGWAPSTTGANYALPPILAPIVDVRTELLVLTGLANRAASESVPGDHARGTGSFITARRCKQTDGADIQNGISLDQRIAQVIGAATSLPSLQLGAESGGSTGNCDSGYSCAYARNISWSGPQTPLAKETNPGSAFDRLFQGPDRPPPSGAARAPPHRAALDPRRRRRGRARAAPRAGQLRSPQARRVPDRRPRARAARREPEQPGGHRHRARRAQRLSPTRGPGGGPR